MVSIAWIGCISFCFFIPLGKIGANEGLNTYIIGEAAFGDKGSTVVTSLVVTAIPCIAWYGIQVSVASNAIGQVLGFGTLGNSILMVILGLVFAIPPLLGVTSMAWLNYVSIPVMFGTVMIGIKNAINLIGGVASIWNYAPVINKGIPWGINIQVGTLLVGACFAADYTRWQENRLSSLTASGILGFYPFATLLTVSGLIMALSAVTLGVDEPWNIVEVMIKIGMPSIALLLIFLLQWTTAITSIYSCGLALTKSFGGKRYFWSILSAILGILLSLTGIVSRFLDFLGIISCWVSPAAGIIIVEYYFISKSKLNRKQGVYWPGIICWLIGGIVAWKVTFFIQSVNAVVVSGLCYFVYHKLMGSNKVVKVEDNNNSGIN